MTRYYDTPSLFKETTKFPKPHSSLKVARHGRGSYSSVPLASQTERGDIINASVVGMVQGLYYSSADQRLRSGGMLSADNKALDELYSEMGQAQDLLVAWRERQQALDMITSSFRTIVRTAQAVKRRDPKLVRAVLRKNPDAKDIIKTPAGLWLGYHFGIVPTIHDIHSAAGLFSQEFPVVPVSVVGGASFFHGDAVFEGWDLDYRATTKIGGVCTSISPHINLATRLGFGQPLSVAWEMTPFSWFIDYFTNVGQLVTNLEPRFPGFRFQGKYVTRRVTYNAMYRSKRTNRKFESVQGRWYARTLGWPNYHLEFKSPFDLKSQQCSYIAAVAIQLLTSMKPK